MRIRLVSPSFSEVRRDEPESCRGPRSDPKALPLIDNPAGRPVRSGC